MRSSAAISRREHSPVHASLDHTKHDSSSHAYTDESIFIHSSTSTHENDGLNHLSFPDRFPRKRIYEEAMICGPPVHRNVVARLAEPVMSINNLPSPKSLSKRNRFSSKPRDKDSVIEQHHRYLKSKVAQYGSQQGSKQSTNDSVSSKSSDHLSTDDSPDNFSHNQICPVNEPTPFTFDYEFDFDQVGPPWQQKETIPNQFPIQTYPFVGGNDGVPLLGTPREE